jgi:hypothetical protein
VDVIFQGVNTVVCIWRLWTDYLEHKEATLMDIQNVVHSPEYHGFKIHCNVGSYKVLTNVSDEDFKDDYTLQDIKKFSMDVSDHLSTTSDGLANGMFAVLLIETGDALQKRYGTDIFYLVQADVSQMN